MRASRTVVFAALAGLASCNASSHDTTPDGPTHDAVSDGQTPDGPPAMCASTSGDPTSPPDVATGPLQLNDVSILFPLSTTYLCASSAGARGELLPEALYNAVGPITGSFLSAGFAGDGSALYPNLHVVSLRVDPCFAALDPDPQGSGCAAQIRLVFQEVTLVSPTPLAFDSGLHAFYSLSRADLLALAQGIAAFRAANSTGRLGALAPSPIIAQQGFDGAYARGIRSLVLQYAGAANLTRVAELSSLNDRIAWRFSTADMVDATADTFTSLVIPTLPGDATVQGFAEAADGTSTNYNPATTSADDLTALAAGSAITTAQAQTAFDALVRIDNPTDDTANTIDCASCHTATPLSLQDAGPRFGLHEEASGSAYQADGTYVLASELTPTFTPTVEVNQLHAFSYIGGGAEINQRVVNESAANVVYLNHALGL